MKAVFALLLIVLVLTKTENSEENKDACFCWTCLGCCCTNGFADTCYSNPNNPCTPDCSTVCADMQCPPNSGRLIGSIFQGDCKFLTINGNCIYNGNVTGFICTPLCLCNPGYVSDFGSWIIPYVNCTINGRWPIFPLNSRVIGATCKRGPDIINKISN